MEDEVYDLPADVSGWGTGWEEEEGTERRTPLAVILMCWLAFLATLYAFLKYLDPS